MSERTPEIVKKIHESPFRAVVAITGGGSEAIGELLRYGGGSATLIEAVIPYSPSSFCKFVGGEPDRYCCGDAACDLAMAAYQRGLLDTTENLIGLGMTCSLVKDNEREGRAHRIYVAFQKADETRLYEYEIRSATGSREEEERFAAEIAIEALAEACEIPFPVDHERLKRLNVTEKVTSVTTDPNILGVNIPAEAADLVAGKIQSMRVPIGKFNADNVFPGAFNPPHEGHERLAENVLTETGSPVHFEICIKNVDKPPLNYIAMARRIEWMKAYADRPWMGDLFFTRTSTFIQKTELFAGATFVVGFDTLKRIADPKYSRDEREMLESFERMQARRCRFIAFHRELNGQKSRDDDYEALPESLRRLTRLFDYDGPSVSSSEIRKNALRGI